jgi:hypothetical protein
MVSNNNYKNRQPNPLFNISSEIELMISWVKLEMELCWDKQTGEKNFSNELLFLFEKIHDAVQEKNFKEVINLLEQLKTHCSTRSTYSFDYWMRWITTVDICVLQDKIIKSTDVCYSDIETIDFSQYKKVVKDSVLSVKDSFHINAYWTIHAYLTILKKIFKEQWLQTLYNQIQNAFINDKYWSLKTLIEQGKNAVWLKTMIPESVWYDMLKIVQDLIDVTSPTSHHQNWKNDILE